MAEVLSSCKLAAASVDWVSCTATTPDAADSLWSLALRCQPERLSESENPTAWHGHGYHGWSVTGIACGARVDGVFLRLSGEQSAYHWREAISTTDNVTRFDLAVDFKAEHPVPRIAHNVYRQAGHNSPRNGRPFKRSLMISSDGGATAYLGSRSSEQFGRVYDKGVEQQVCAPGLWWRFELELKKDAALSCAKALLLATDYQRSLIATTMDWFRARGVEVQKTWEPLEVLNLKLPVARADKRLQWISRCVRPTVMDLLDTLGRERMLGVLGIPVYDSSPMHSAPQGARSALPCPQPAKSFRRPSEDSTMVS